MWVRRERLRLCEPVGTWIGPVTVGVSWLTGLVGDQLGAQLFVHLSGLGIVVGCFLSVLGVDVLRQFLPVFAALLMVVPIPWGLHERVGFPLVIAVADLSLLLYEAFGIHAERNGPFMVIGDNTAPLVAACGVPGLKVTFLIAYGLAFGQPLKTWVRVLILAAGPVAAVLCQVFGTLLAMWLVTFALDGRAIDFLTGWLVLPVVFVVLLGLVKLLGWASVPVQYYTLAQDR